MVITSAAYTHAHTCSHTHTHTHNGRKLLENCIRRRRRRRRRQRRRRPRFGCFAVALATISTANGGKANGMMAPPKQKQSLSAEQWANKVTKAANKNIENYNIIIIIYLFFFFLIRFN